MPAADGVPLIVTTFDDHEPLTPVGKPLKLAPVAPVVVYVISVIAVLIHAVWAFVPAADDNVTVLFAVTVTVLSAVAAVQPVPAFDVSLSVTVPLKFAAGVYVTDAGDAVCAVLLNVPPPDTIDHAPVVALPPTLAPANAKATGDADRQTVFGPPAVATAAAFTTILPVAVTVPQPPVNVTV